MKIYLYGTIALLFTTFLGYFSYLYYSVEEQHTNKKVSKAQNDIIEQYQKAEKELLDETLKDINANAITKINEVEIDTNGNNNGTIWMLYSPTD